MVVALLIILLVNILFILTVSASRLSKQKSVRRLLVIFSILHSGLVILFFIKFLIYRGEFSDNGHISDLMNITLLVSLWTIPAIFILGFSNTSHVSRKKFPLLSAIINNTGTTMAVAIIITVLSGYLHGRFNFQVEKVTVSIDSLPDALDGLTIAHVSDLHISSFHHHKRQLKKAVDIIEQLDADIVVNTGDFVSFGYNEMKPFTEALKTSTGKIGNFAILGNHDMGTYHPGWGSIEKAKNIEQLSAMVRETGFDLLVDENRMIEIDGSTLAIIGITTSGSIPDITYGDYKKASDGTQNADLRIFLSHDPDYWINNHDILDNVELTLSGHTHGMQIGLLTRWFNISPASIIFDAWYGLYGENNCFLYVNRGLGTLGFPFRIGMPPEITLITLKNKKGISTGYTPPGSYL